MPRVEATPTVQDLHALSRKRRRLLAKFKEKPEGNYKPENDIALERAHDAFSRNDLETAQDLVLQVLERKPDSAKGFRLLGLISAALGNVDREFACRLAAAHLAPTRSEWLELARISLEKGDAQTASYCLDRYQSSLSTAVRKTAITANNVTIHRALVNARRDRGRAHWLAGDPFKAIKAFGYSAKRSQLLRTIQNDDIQRRRALQIATYENVVLNKPLPTSLQEQAAKSPAWVAWKELHEKWKDEFKDELLVSSEGSQQSFYDDSGDLKVGEDASAATNKEGEDDEDDEDDGDHTKPMHARLAFYDDQQDAGDAPMDIGARSARFDGMEITGIDYEAAQELEQMLRDSEADLLSFTSSKKQRKTTPEDQEQIAVQRRQLLAARLKAQGLELDEDKLRELDESLHAENIHPNSMPTNPQVQPTEVDAFDRLHTSIRVTDQSIGKQALSTPLTPAEFLDLLVYGEHLLQAVKHAVALHSSRASTSSQPQPPHLPEHVCALRRTAIMALQSILASLNATLHHELKSAVSDLETRLDQVAMLCAATQSNVFTSTTPISTSAAGREANAGIAAPSAHSKLLQYTSLGTTGTAASSASTTVILRPLAITTNYFINWHPTLLSEFARTKFQQFAAQVAEFTIESMHSYFQDAGPSHYSQEDFMQRITVLVESLKQVMARRIDPLPSVDELIRCIPAFIGVEEEEFDDKEEGSRDEPAERATSLWGKPSDDSRSLLGFWGSEGDHLSGQRGASLLATFGEGTYPDESSNAANDYDYDNGFISQSLLFGLSAFVEDDRDTSPSSAEGSAREEARKAREERKRQREQQRRIRNALQAALAGSRYYRLRPPTGLVKVNPFLRDLHAFTLRHCLRRRGIASLIMDRSCVDVNAVRKRVRYSLSQVTPSYHAVRKEMTDRGINMIWYGVDDGLKILSDWLRNACSYYAAPLEASTGTIIGCGVEVPISAAIALNTDHVYFQSFLNTSAGLEPIDIVTVLRARLSHLLPEDESNYGAQGERIDPANLFTTSAPTSAASHMVPAETEQEVESTDRYDYDVEDDDDWGLVEQLAMKAGWREDEDGNFVDTAYQPSHEPWIGVPREELEQAKREKAMQRTLDPSTGDTIVHAPPMSTDGEDQPTGEVMVTAHCDLAEFVVLACLATTSFNLIGATRALLDHPLANSISTSIETNDEDNTALALLKDWPAKEVNYGLDTGFLITHTRRLGALHGLAGDGLGPATPQPAALLKLLVGLSKNVARWVVSQQQVLERFQNTGLSDYQFPPLQTPLVTPSHIILLYAIRASCSLSKRRLGRLVQQALLYNWEPYQLLTCAFQSTSSSELGQSVPTPLWALMKASNMQEKGGCDRIGFNLYPLPEFALSDRPQARVDRVCPLLGSLATAGIDPQRIVHFDGQLSTFEKLDAIGKELNDLSQSLALVSKQWAPLAVIWTSEVRWRALLAECEVRRVGGRPVTASHRWSTKKKKKTAIISDPENEGREVDADELQDGEESEGGASEGEEAETGAGEEGEEEELEDEGDTSDEDFEQSKDDEEPENERQHTPVVGETVVEAMTSTNAETTAEATEAKGADQAALAEGEKEGGQEIDKEPDHEAFMLTRGLDEAAQRHARIWTAKELAYFWDAHLDAPLSSDGTSLGDTRWLAKTYYSVMMRYFDSGDVTGAYDSADDYARLASKGLISHLEFNLAAWKKIQKILSIRISRDAKIIRAAEWWSAWDGWAGHALRSLFFGNLMVSPMLHVAQIYQTHSYVLLEPLAHLLAPIQRSEQALSAANGLSTLGFGRLALKVLNARELLLSTLTASISALAEEQAKLDHELRITFPYFTSTLALNPAEALELAKLLEAHNREAQCTQSMALAELLHLECQAVSEFDSSIAKQACEEDQTSAASFTPHASTPSRVLLGPGPLSRWLLVPCSAYPTSQSTSAGTSAAALYLKAKESESGQDQLSTGSRYASLRGIMALDVAPSLRFFQPQYELIRVSTEDEERSGKLESTAASTSSVMAQESMGAPVWRSRSTTSHDSIDPFASSVRTYWYAASFARDDGEQSQQDSQQGPATFSPLVLSEAELTKLESIAAECLALRLVRSDAKYMGRGLLLYLLLTSGVWDVDLFTDVAPPVHNLFPELSTQIAFWRLNPLQLSDPVSQLESLFIPPNKDSDIHRLLQADLDSGSTTSRLIPQELSALLELSLSMPSSWIHARNELLAERHRRSSAADIMTDTPQIDKRQLAFYRVMVIAPTFPVFSAIAPCLSSNILRSRMYEPLDFVCDGTHGLTGLAFTIADGTPSKSASLDPMRCEALFHHIEYGLRTGLARRLLALHEAEKEARRADVALEVQLTEFDSVYKAKLQGVGLTMDGLRDLAESPMAATLAREVRDYQGLSSDDALGSIMLRTTDCDKLLRAKWVEDVRLMNKIDATLGSLTRRFGEYEAATAQDILSYESHVLMELDRLDLGVEYDSDEEHLEDLEEDDDMCEEEEEETSELGDTTPRTRARVHFPFTITTKTRSSEYIRSVRAVASRVQRLFTQVVSIFSDATLSDQLKWRTEGISNALRTWAMSSLDSSVVDLPSRKIVLDPLQVSAHCHLAKYAMPRLPLHPIALRTELAQARMLQREWVLTTSSVSPTQANAASDASRSPAQCAAAAAVLWFRASQSAALAAHLHMFTLRIADYVSEARRWKAECLNAQAHRMTELLKQFNLRDKKLEEARLKRDAEIRQQLEEERARLKQLKGDPIPKKKRRHRHGREEDPEGGDQDNQDAKSSEAPAPNPTSVDDEKESRDGGARLNSAEIPSLELMTIDVEPGSTVEAPSSTRSEPNQSTVEVEENNEGSVIELDTKVGKRQRARDRHRQQDSKRVQLSIEDLGGLLEAAANAANMGVEIEPPPLSGVTESETRDEGQSGKSSKKNAKAKGGSATEEQSEPLDPIRELELAREKEQERQRKLEQRRERARERRRQRRLKLQEQKNEDRMADEAGEVSSDDGEDSELDEESNQWLQDLEQQLNAEPLVVPLVSDILRDLPKATALRLVIPPPPAVPLWNDAVERDMPLSWFSERAAVASYRAVAEGALSATQVGLRICSLDTILHPTTQRLLGLSHLGDEDTQETNLPLSRFSTALARVIQTCSGMAVEASLDSPHLLDGVMHLAQNSLADFYALKLPYFIRIYSEHTRPLVPATKSLLTSSIVSGNLAAVYDPKACLTLDPVRAFFPKAQSRYMICPPAITRLSRRVGRAVPLPRFAAAADLWSATSVSSRVARRFQPPISEVIMRIPTPEELAGSMSVRYTGDDPLVVNPRDQYFLKLPWQGQRTKMARFTLAALQSVCHSLLSDRFMNLAALKAIVAQYGIGIQHNEDEATSEQPAETTESNSNDLTFNIVQFISGLGLVDDSVLAETVKDPDQVKFVLDWFRHSANGMFDEDGALEQWFVSTFPVDQSTGESVSQLDRNARPTSALSAALAGIGELTDDWESLQALGPLALWSWKPRIPHSYAERRRTDRVTAFVAFDSTPGSGFYFNTERSNGQGVNRDEENPDEGTGLDEEKTVLESSPEEARVRQNTASLSSMERNRSQPIRIDGISFMALASQQRSGGLTFGQFDSQRESQIVDQLSWNPIGPRFGLADKLGLCPEFADDIVRLVSIPLQQHWSKDDILSKVDPPAALHSEFVSAEAERTGIQSQTAYSLQSSLLHVRQSLLKSLALCHGEPIAIEPEILRQYATFVESNFATYFRKTPFPWLEPHAFIKEATYGILSLTGSVVDLGHIMLRMQIDAEGFNRQADRKKFMIAVLDTHQTGITKLCFIALMRVSIKVLTDNLGLSMDPVDWTDERILEELQVQLTSELTRYRSILPTSIVTTLQLRTDIDLDAIEASYFELFDAIYSAVSASRRCIDGVTPDLHEAPARRSVIVIWTLFSSLFKTTYEPNESSDTKNESELEESEYSTPYRELFLPARLSVTPEEWPLPPKVNYRENPLFALCCFVSRRVGDEVHPPLAASMQQMWITLAWVNPLTSLQEVTWLQRLLALCLAHGRLDLVEQYILPSVRATVGVCLALRDALPVYPYLEVSGFDPVQELSFVPDSPKWYKATKVSRRFARASVDSMIRTTKKDLDPTSVITPNPILSHPEYMTPSVLSVNAAITEPFLTVSPYSTGYGSFLDVLYCAAHVSTSAPLNAYHLCNELMRRGSELAFEPPKGSQDDGSGVSTSPSNAGQGGASIPSAWLPKIDRSTIEKARSVLKYSTFWKLSEDICRIAQEMFETEMPRAVESARWRPAEQATCIWGTNPLNLWLRTRARHRLIYETIDWIIMCGERSGLSELKWRYDKVEELIGVREQSHDEPSTSDELSHAKDRDFSVLPQQLSLAKIHLVAAELSSTLHPLSLFIPTISTTLTPIALPTTAALSDLYTSSDEAFFEEASGGNTTCDCYSHRGCSSRTCLGSIFHEYLSTKELRGGQGRRQPKSHSFTMLRVLEITGEPLLAFSSYSSLKTIARMMYIKAFRHAFKAHALTPFSPLAFKILMNIHIALGAPTAALRRIYRDRVVEGVGTDPTTNVLFMQVGIATVNSLMSETASDGVQAWFTTTFSQPVEVQADAAVGDAPSEDASSVQNPLTDSSDDSSNRSSSISEHIGDGDRSSSGPIELGSQLHTNSGSEVIRSEATSLIIKTEDGIESADTSGTGGSEEPPDSFPYSVVAAVAPGLSILLASTELQIIASRVRSALLKKRAVLKSALALARARAAVGKVTNMLNNREWHLLRGTTGLVETYNLARGLLRSQIVSSAQELFKQVAATGRRVLVTIARNSSAAIEEQYAAWCKWRRAARKLLSSLSSLRPHHAVSAQTDSATAGPSSSASPTQPQSQTTPPAPKSLDDLLSSDDEDEFVWNTPMPQSTAAVSESKPINLIALDDTDVDDKEDDDLIVINAESATAPAEPSLQCVSCPKHAELERTFDAIDYAYLRARLFLTRVAEFPHASLVRLTELLCRQSPSDRESSSRLSETGFGDDVGGQMDLVARRFVAQFSDDICRSAEQCRDCEGFDKLQPILDEVSDCAAALLKLPVLTGLSAFAMTVHSQLSSSTMLQRLSGYHLVSVGDTLDTSIPSSSTVWSEQIIVALEPPAQSRRAFNSPLIGPDHAWNPFAASGRLLLEDELSVRNVMESLRGFIGLQSVVFCALYNNKNIEIYGAYMR